MFRHLFRPTPICGGAKSTCWWCLNGQVRTSPIVFHGLCLSTILWHSKQGMQLEKKGWTNRWSTGEQQQQQITGRLETLAHQEGQQASSKAGNQRKISSSSSSRPEANQQARSSKTSKQKQAVAKQQAGASSQQHQSQPAPAKAAANQQQTTCTCGDLVMSCG